MQTLKKLLTLGFMLIFLTFRAAPLQAIEAPAAPAVPNAPTIESSISTSESLQAPEPPPAPSIEEVISNEEESSPPSLDSQTTNQEVPKSNGTEIESGDTQTHGTFTTTGNNNINEANNDTSIQASNTDNGVSSENIAAVETQNNNITVQENQAEVENTLELETRTGDNSASFNTGEDSSITTGDANTTGTIITSLNTNVDAVSVSEFNITGTQEGDLSLDFDANCISGCSGPISAENTGNGANSENNVLINDLSNKATFQTNDADVDNTLILSSDSGQNTASYNTNGDSVIQTGDANTSGNVLTFTNNNIAGKIIFGVVNIFGNLVGDIILPENFTDCPDCQGDILAANSNNGAGSENNTAVNISDAEEVFQSNLADIENNFVVAATTGDNKTSYNTNGSSSITAGDADATVQAINIANSNIEGDNMWLVIVNKAGEWVGQILGAPEGSNFAGSTGTEFSVNSNGEITATNSGNGADSENDTIVSQNNTSTTVQENIAKIVNNLILSSNTGGNQASYNTGGDSKIQTGDAKAIANLVNFVNNNISGNGKLIITVVNVFGSWVGDFVTPGNKKEETANTQNTVSQPNISEISSSNNTYGSPQIASADSVPQSTTLNPIIFNNSNPQNPLPLQNLISSTNSQNNPPTRVASEKVENNPTNILAQEAKEIKKKVNINFAWLLLLLPSIPLFYLARRKSN